MKAKGFCTISIIAVIVMCLAAAASAEIVGRTADGYIHRYAADNGQEIYFVSNTEEAVVRIDDVNFDGHPDLAVVTAQGGSNTWYEFYLWNGSGYEYAERWTGDIANYQLADGKYLLSRTDDGSGGMLFHAQICVWEGSILKTVRTMASEEEYTIVWEGRIKTETTDLDRLHVTLWETDGPVGAADVLWDKTWTQFPDGADVLEEMDAHLWEGLRD